VLIPLLLFCPALQAQRCGSSLLAAARLGRD